MCLRLRIATGARILSVRRGAPPGARPRSVHESSGSPGKSCRWVVRECAQCAASRGPRAAARSSEGSTRASAPARPRWCRRLLFRWPRGLVGHRGLVDVLRTCLGGPDPSHLRRRSSTRELPLCLGPTQKACRPYGALEFHAGLPAKDRPGGRCACELGPGSSGGSIWASG